MRIIEIKALENGAHRNQTSDYIPAIPEGYAVIPDEMELKNFPFGEVEVEEIDGIMTVKKWVPGIAPEPKEIEEPISLLEQLRADIDFLALMTEVEL